MSSSLSGEITNTRAKTKRNVRLFHVGRKGKFFHSSAKSILMVERASSFPGTNNIERFTNKLCCITLIQTRKGKSSNISRHFQFKKQTPNFNRRQHLQNSKIFGRRKVLCIMIKSSLQWQRLKKSWAMVILLASVLPRIATVLEILSLQALEKPKVRLSLFCRVMVQQDILVNNRHPIFKLVFTAVSRYSSLCLSASWSQAFLAETRETGNGNRERTTRETRNCANRLRFSRKAEYVLLWKKLGTELFRSSLLHSSCILVNYW